MTGQMQKVTTLKCIQFHSGLHGMKSNIYYHNNELIANVNILLELENDGIAYDRRASKAHELVQLCQNIIFMFYNFMQLFGLMINTKCSQNGFK